jgi:hypothetical protein
MKLSRSYNKEDYEDPFIVVSLCYEERQRAIEHEKKLDEARSKRNKRKNKSFLSLSLQVKRGVERNPMTKDKNRYSFLRLQSPRKKMNQSRYTIPRKKS